MKQGTSSSLKLCVMASLTIILSACQPSGTGGSDGGENTSPRINEIHTFTRAYENHHSASSDMVLMVFIDAEDDDGWSDLDRAVFDHPNGTSYTADADTYTDEFNDIKVLMVPFHMDTNASDGIRQFAMTGYRVELFDKAGNSTSRDFDVYGFEGEAVPLGTQMVHPEDYSVNGSGGDYRSGLGFAKVESVTVNADSVSLDVTINDDRVSEMTFYFADSDETFFAHYFEGNADNITVNGTDTYTISEDQLDFTKDGFQLSDIDNIGISAYDSGRLNTGPFKGVSQLGSNIGVYDLTP